MGHINNPPKITFHSILLVAGILLCFVYFLWPSYNYPGHYVLDPESHEFTLSEDSPVYRFNLTHTQVGISNIQTNDTHVSLIVRDSNQVIFNSTNITSLSGYSIEIPQSGLSNDWWIEVIRQDFDASVNLTTYYEFYVAITVAAIMEPFWAPFVGVALSGFATYKLLTEKSDGKKRKKIVTAILLLIIGPLCCYPFLLGVSNDDFTPVNTSMSLPDVDYSFTLNISNPIASIDLSLLIPEEGSSVSFNIHSIDPSEFPLQLSVMTDETNNLTMEIESNVSDWSITIPSESTSSATISFERIDTDIEIEISVEVNYRVLVPGENIIVPAILGILGLSGIIIGLLLAFRIERKLSFETMEFNGPEVR